MPGWEQIASPFSDPASTGICSAEPIWAEATGFASASWYGGEWITEMVMTGDDAEQIAAAYDRAFAVLSCSDSPEAIPLDLRDATRSAGLENLSWTADGTRQNAVVAEIDDGILVVVHQAKGSVLAMAETASLAKIAVAAANARSMWQGWFLISALGLFVALAIWFRGYLALALILGFAAADMLLIRVQVPTLATYPITMAAVLTLLTHRQLRSSSKASFEPVPADDADRAGVAQLTDIGLEVCSAILITTGKGKLLRLVVLRDPAGRFCVEQLAIPPRRTMAFLTPIGDGFLETEQKCAIPPGPKRLVQVFPKQSATDLRDAHQQALEYLLDNGIEVTEVSRSEAATAIIASNRDVQRAIRDHPLRATWHATWRGLTRRWLNLGPIWDHPDTVQRIERLRDGTTARQPN